MEESTMTGTLASWQEDEAKRRIGVAIRDMTEDGSEAYVPPEERIAVFDNDGTLWCEKPSYVQALFLVARWKEMAANDPSLREVQPYKAAVEGDDAWFLELGEHTGEVLEAVGVAYEGITPDQFDEAVRAFFESARHPRFGERVGALVYRPMRELIDLLRENEFKVFLTTGGGRDFVRVVSEELYGIPRENVIGSSVVLEYRDGHLIRTTAPSLPIDDGAGKPVHIFERIGRPPVLAVGNSNGDIPMLQMARVGILLHHDDAEREYAYDHGAEKALGMAEQEGWIVVNMRSDFKEVFAHRERTEPA